MSPEQRAALLGVAAQMEAAAKALAGVWTTLPKQDQQAIEAIPGMDHFDRLLASDLREYLVRQEMEVV